MTLSSEGNLMLVDLSYYYIYDRYDSPWTDDSLSDLKRIFIALLESGTRVVEKRRNAR